MTQEVIDAVLKADVRCILSKGWSDRISSKVPQGEIAQLGPEPEIPLRFMSSSLLLTTGYFSKLMLQHTTAAQELRVPACGRASRPSSGRSSAISSSSPAG
uniref:Uncharacterized protein n=1 Tax=Bionectria ochroleuca TaxID=29856 RepID=A0A8H7MZF8_BIOOC